MMQNDLSRGTEASYTARHPLYEKRVCEEFIVAYFQSYVGLEFLTSLSRFGADLVRGMGQT